MGTLSLRCIEDTPIACVVDAHGTTLRVTAGGDRVAWFRDPDENLLSLTQRA